MKAILIICLILTMANTVTPQTQPAWMEESITKLKRDFWAKQKDDQRVRLARGLKQVSDYWRQEDGPASEFVAFVKKHFANDQASLDVLFNRFEELLEKLDGHMHEIGIAFHRQSDLDLGPIYPVDEIFAAYAPSAHVTDDFFDNKIAFVALLNFPLTTLDQRLVEGENWTRRQWAETRLAHKFSKRIPADVNAAISLAASEADQYVSEYNIWMHHVIDGSGNRLFPPKMRLLSHWNLRDEIKANYAHADGLAKQRTIQRVMERIVTQTIPAVVVNNPGVDWNPFSNDVMRSSVKDWDGPSTAVASIANAPEPDTRYAMLLKTFAASKKADRFSPTAPTLIDRQFDENRELPEARVKAMLEQILGSPLVKEIAMLIEKRLGRPLEPFDIWYNGFRAGSKRSQQEVEDIVTKLYPTAEAYEKDMPKLLVKLGFTLERADYIARNILVEPARGSGHASGAEMRSAKARLRTRVEKTGMNYKGFNIAVHEMGHNVEQVISLNNIDHWLLHGVPNTAFTEALAFVFQGHDLELLGLSAADPQSAALKALNEFWGTYEIAGVALVDMAVWHWMYDYPGATPAQLKEATLSISKEIWNKYYAPVFDKEDVSLLGIYSHMISYFLYLPDYPIGHMIAFQIEEQMNKAGSIGTEFERIARFGNISPDIWMKKATGAPVGPEALLAAAKKALQEMER